MLFIKNTTLLAIFLAMSACTKPINYTDTTLSTYDKDTKYAITENSTGFSTTVHYARYQFIPESSAVATACKSALTSIAWEYAEKMNREIRDINEQRIRISMGRNGLTGITSCQAFVTAQWK